MIEIRITKELGSYEPKFIASFTFRQVVCLAVGAIFCYLIYKITFPYLPVDIAGFFCCIPAAVAVLFGWAKPYGMKMEKFIQSVGVNVLLAPTHRRYKTKNVQEELLHVLEKAEEEEASKGVKGKKKTDRKPKAKKPQNDIPEFYL